MSHGKPREVDVIEGIGCKAGEMGLEVESETTRRGVHLTTEITSVGFFSTVRPDVIMIVTGGGETFTTNVTGIRLFTCM